jgi:hypothetical protein
MKILKKLLFVVAGILVLWLLIALFMPKDYNVERQVVINKPKTEVFDYIKYVKNQDNFSKWNQLDPNMKKSYSGTDGTVGFIYGWNSDNGEAGVGEQEIKNITEGERVDFELRFKEPMEATSMAYMITEGVSDAETNVKWGFNGRMPYPFNIFLPLMKSQLGKDFQTGLDNLKKVMESQPSPAAQSAEVPATETASEATPAH